jgi:hypothetical protein
MNTAEFKALRAKAGELFSAQPARDKLKVSLDAIFMALASQAAEPAKVRRTSDEEAPEWFVDTLKKLRGTGERVTVGRFLLLAGKFPSTRSDALNVGRWLREAGITPRKTGGNMLFEL